MPNYIDDDTALPATKENRRNVPPGESSTKFWRAEDANATFAFLEDARDAIQALQAASQPAISAWSAGTYAQGQIVTRGPYMWMCNSTTTEDPMVVEGDLGSASDWDANTGAGTPGFDQSGGRMLLIDGALGSAVAAFRQSVNTGFLGKMLIVDAQISGTADELMFGVYDSTAAQTAGNLNGLSGFYGIGIDIFNGRLQNYADGTAGSNSSYARADATNAADAYTRWYLSMIQNGSNWNLLVYRDSRVSATAFTGQSALQVDDLACIGSITNVARPSYSTWRFVVGARTGGAAGTFAVRAAYVRNLTSGAWTAIGRLPTQLG